MIRVSHFISQKFWFRKSGAGIRFIGGVEAYLYMNFPYNRLSSAWWYFEPVHIRSVPYHFKLFCFSIMDEGRD
jgi:hypothetical protein